MIVRLIVIGAAVTAALLPTPAGLVERWYSRGLYAWVQPWVTSVTNAVPVALLDVALLALLSLLVLSFARRWRRGGLRRALWRGSLDVITAAAAIYVVFLLAWGLNYRRVPLEQQLQHDPARASREAGVALVHEAARRVNAAHAHAADTAFHAGQLASAFGDAQRLLGRGRLAVPGAPKRSLLQRYFRVAAIDGMTNPFFHEVILHPELLPFEEPFVLAHEWAHLAGYADESEAGFVAWLTCTRGDALAQYSGWLALFRHVYGGLAPADRRALGPILDEGPRRDLQAIAVRLDRSRPVVRAVAREAYDHYLRANRVDEGIASYDLMVRLILGTEFQAGWVPQLR